MYLHTKELIVVSICSWIICQLIAIQISTGTIIEYGHFKVIHANIEAICRASQICNFLVGHKQML